MCSCSALCVLYKYIILLVLCFCDDVHTPSTRIDVSDLLSFETWYSYFSAFYFLKIRICKLELRKNNENN